MGSSLVDEVAKIYVFPTQTGIRWTARTKEEKIVADSPQSYPSRYKARSAALKRWPNAAVIFETK